MKKRICSALLAGLLLLALSACTPEYHESEDTYPTLPSFPEEQTPLQQLEAAIAAAKTAGSRTVRYGTIHKTGEEITEETHSQTVSETQPFDRDALYAAVTYFPDNENFLQDFCNQPIRAIPSNTGTIRYQLTGLSCEDANRLLFSRSLYREYDSAVWAIFMDLDAEGRFCRLEVTAETQAETMSAFLSITFPDSP